jgi:hypothetical protein
VIASGALLKASLSTSPNGRAASGDWSVSEHNFVPLDSAENANFSMNERLRSLSAFSTARSETIVKMQMDEILRFWAEVACENLQSSGANLTKRQLLAQILQQYERRGDAMRYLNGNGKIAWKASPRFLMMLADAERDARNDLAGFP